MNYTNIPTFDRESNSYVESLDHFHLERRNYTPAQLRIWARELQAGEQVEGLLATDDEYTLDLIRTLYEIPLTLEEKSDPLPKTQLREIKKEFSSIITDNPTLREMVYAAYQRFEKLRELSGKAYGTDDTTALGFEWYEF